MLTHDILFKRSPLNFIAFYSPLHANKWKFDLQPWGPFTITVQSSDYLSEILIQEGYHIIEMLVIATCRKNVKMLISLIFLFVIYYRI